LEQELEKDLQSMDIRACPRRRMPRIAAKEKPDIPKTLWPTKRSRANQFCVYNILNESSKSTYRVVVYINGYKLPCKVKLGLIYGGLDEIDIDKVMVENTNKSLTVCLQQALMRLLSQPFSYIVHTYTQVGVFSIGEVDIYLRIDDDPYILLYHLSIPKGDISMEIGWDRYSI
jgi:hypothetical protein